MRYVGHITFAISALAGLWLIVAPPGGQSPFPDLSIGEWALSIVLIFGVLVGILALAGVISWLDGRFGEPAPVVTEEDWADFNGKLVTWNEQQLLALHEHLAWNDPRRRRLEMILGIGDPF